ncbi:unnamed protein product [Coccothraustes coccothraustes]
MSQRLHRVGLAVLFQHEEHHITPLPTQVFILSPAFLKYIHDNWTEHHGSPCLASEQTVKGTGTTTGKKSAGLEPFTG